MKILSILFFITVLAPLTAFAAGSTPAPAPDKGIARIGWAADCAGKMPEELIVLLAVLAALMIPVIAYCIKNKEGK